jgi:hypothetical protein
MLLGHAMHGLVTFAVYLGPLALFGVSIAIVSVRNGRRARRAGTPDERAGRSA